MERQQQIALAHAEILRDAQPGDPRLTGGGKVRVEALSDLLGFEVAAAERDEAEAAGAPAPQAPAPEAPAAEDGPRAELLRKAEALKVEADPAWSIEKLGEEVAAAEERERQRAATSARLQRAAEQRSIKARIAQKTVQCRIMKAGDNRISAGVHIAGQGDLKYERGEIVDIPERAARSYEDRGYVEIL